MQGTNMKMKRFTLIRSTIKQVGIREMLHTFVAAPILTRIRNPGLHVFNLSKIWHNSVWG